MIIKRLTLHNFGVYAGTNSFIFEANKPIALIGGLNGRGKTTFLEAVLLALYGANSFAYRESRYDSYGKYLRSYTNTADSSFSSFVELEFILNKNDTDHYVINRSWSATTKRIREKIVVQKNDEYNVFLTENWSIFIESILPNGLSNFFFFDGEKIAELAVEETNSQMKESIKALLGISTLDQLEADLHKIVSRATKQSINPFDQDELDVLRLSRDQAQNDYQLALDQISELSQKRDDLGRKLEQLKSEYSAKGGDIVKKQHDLFAERSELQAKKEAINNHLIELSASALPLSLVFDLLTSINEQADRERNSQIAETTVQRLDSLHDQYIRLNPIVNQSMTDFMEFVRTEAEKERVNLVFNFSEQGLFLLKNTISSQLYALSAAVNDASTERDRVQKRQDEVDRYLSIDIDESALSRIYRKMKETEQEIIDDEVAIAALEKKASSLHGIYLRASSSFNAYVEKLLETLELSDDNDRLLKYSSQAIELLTQYRIELQRQKVGELAETISRCYKQLANKKNHIERIIMDADTLDFRYVDTEENDVPKASLSAGEKQLMVISMLWALAICSKKRLPVIIDTPLSRLDSAHRASLISTYFPQASEQTIILSTDVEIDSHDYDLMKSSIGDEFTLVYDDTTKRSTITPGYFCEGANDC